MLQQPTLERDRSQTFRDISERRPFDVSKALLHGCDQKTVRDSIFALRRGPVRYSRGAMIACEGDAPDYIYVVVSGVVRSCKTHRDGSRGIVAFNLPGDLFGWSGEPVHPLSLEAAQIQQCCFSNAALCLPPPCMTAELQVIFWPLRQTSFDARKRLCCW